MLETQEPLLLHQALQLDIAGGGGGRIIEREKEGARERGKNGVAGGRKKGEGGGGERDE